MNTGGEEGLGPGLPSALLILGMWRGRDLSGCIA